MINAGFAGWFLVYIFAICAKYAMRHARVASEKLDGDATQTKCPRGEEVKSGVPREIIVARGGFEEDDGRAFRDGGFCRDEARHPPNLEVVEVARDASFYALGIEFFEHGHFLGVFCVAKSTVKSVNNKGEKLYLRSCAK